MKRLTVLALILTAALVVVATSAAGAGFSLTSDIDLNRGERGAPGSSLEIASQATPDGLVGRSCLARLTSSNNESVHPGNALVVDTGAEVVVFRDVEATASAINETESNVVLGERVTMAIQFGPNGVTSTQFTVSFNCPDTSTTTVPPTTEPPVTTTIPGTVPPPPPTTIPPSDPEPPTPCDPSEPGSPCTLTG